MLAPARHTRLVALRRYLGRYSDPASMLTGSPLYILTKI